MYRKGNIMFTTRQAAELLNISPRRVLALIGAGYLKAERFGKSWMIEEDSVRSRIENPVRRGRPLMNDPDPEHFQSYTLMMKNVPICDFTYNTSKIAVASIANIYNSAVTPLGIYSKPGHIDPYSLSHWISKRCVPSLRPSLPEQLLAAGATSPVDLMFKSLGLNLSDQFWFRPAGYDLDWANINCFENDYESTKEHVRLQMNDAGFSPRPNSSTPGELEKHWHRSEDGISYLIKSASGIDNREPYSEILSTKLLSRILQPEEYVAYSLEQHGGLAWSACPTFITPDAELVPAEDVFIYFGDTGGDTISQYSKDCRSLGVAGIGTAVDKMIVVDFLMANPDRHTYNFGLIRNVETGKFTGVAPLFDNGAAFGAKQTVYDIVHGFPYISNPFSEYPLTQLGMARDYSWLDLSALDGFDDEIRSTLSQNPAMSEELIEGIASRFEHDVRTVADFQRQHLPRPTIATALEKEVQPPTAAHTMNPPAQRIQQAPVIAEDSEAARKSADTQNRISHNGHSKGAPLR